MKLTKQSLRAFLNERPAITPRGLALHARVNENAINQLYNKKDLPLTNKLRIKLLEVLPIYGYSEAKSSTT